MFLIQYEIRGVLEEHQEDIAKASVLPVTSHRHLVQLPNKTLVDIAVEATYNRMFGFYTMWCMFNNKELADDASNEI